MELPSGLPRKFSIKFTIGCLFLITTTITSIFAIGLQYYFGKQISQDYVLSKLSVASNQVSDYVQRVEKSAMSNVQLLRSVAVSTDHIFAEQEIRDIFIQVLTDNPIFYSIYFGRDNDDFYQIINLASSPVVRERIGATSSDRWVVIKISGRPGERLRQNYYYNSEFKLNKLTSERSNYYPTRRPWFAKAPSDSVFKTEPYLFQHLKITGQTYSIRSVRGVIGVDIVLSSLEDKIAPQEIGLPLSSGAESFIFNERGVVIASNKLSQDAIEIPPPKSLILSEKQISLIESTHSLMVSNQKDWGPYDFSVSGQPMGYAVDVLNLVAQQTGIKLEFINGFDSKMLSEKYRKGNLDILHSVIGEPQGFGEKSLPIFKSSVAIAGRDERLNSKTLKEVDEKHVGVVAGFGMKQWLKDNYPKLNILEYSSFDNARAAFDSGEVHYLADSEVALSGMVSLGQDTPFNVFVLNDHAPVPFHVFMKSSDSELLGIINQAISAITPEQREALYRKWLDTKWQQHGVLPYSKVYELAKVQDKQNDMVKIDIGDQTKYLYIAQLEPGSKSSDYFAVIIPEGIISGVVIERILTSIIATAFAMLMLCPLAWNFGSPIVKRIKELKRETAKIKARKFDDLKIVSTRISELSELSQSISDMGQAIGQHEKQQEDFVEAIVRLIAQAIDDKSPYTAGHCNRVPEIAMMLAEAADKSQKIPFKNFSFNTEDEKREFRIAAWLHDCGKITTPEHVVDKGTKLEANYNRIHEIRTRFEVLWRDSEIEYYKTILEGKETAEKALNLLNDRKLKLTQDFEFVANSNIGAEFMSSEQIDRIREIADQTWVRNFDASLGLSPFEQSKRSNDNLDLPALEYLLADKPEHITHRTRPVEFEPKLGIKMAVPEYEGNYGEIYNLSISKGTLTTEERYKINEHMISGIKMLEALPFPPELSRVPRYASTHHETLKGTGYPRKLKAQDLLIPDRILAIADIFEALTAADRPYKKAKPVSVALDIMYKMALDEHIDFDLFILFLESEVYLEYAHIFLPESQLDPVNIQKYFRTTEIA
ncbi:HD domain-containing phosphohydrolase [Vibrio campbellii]|uniref:Transporter substrate-binding domain-containing protein n=1 Tax=Vibrio campbellii TaxID=680 RepID=A0ABY5I9B9_9VIBR|nr:HD domain-containing phosphohydrolase [Vibrio campbellii]UTZ21688.1 transporter substrate-binding domain-containing protein [Vibrio campbellii]UTZ30923.1 transporter substrate-binding domain-containing protein [Vibrio campbellii]